MKLPPALTTVTLISKLLALLFFILFPLASFYAGMEYQRLISSSEALSVETGLRPVSTPSPRGVTATTPTPTGDLASQVPTGTWKTYRNEEYGFEFKYPPDWKLKKYVSLDEIALGPNEPASEEDYQTLDIYPGLITIKDISGYENFISNHALTVNIGRDQNISAVKSESYTDETGPNPYFWNKHVVTYGIPKNVLITYRADLEIGEDKYLETFDQILSTFRFLNE